MVIVYASFSLSLSTCCLTQRGLSVSGLLKSTNLRELSHRSPGGSLTKWRIWGQSIDVEGVLSVNVRFQPLISFSMPIHDIEPSSRVLADLENTHSHTLSMLARGKLKGSGGPGDIHWMRCVTSIL